MPADTGKYSCSSVFARLFCLKKRWHILVALLLITLLVVVVYTVRSQNNAAISDGEADANLRVQARWEGGLGALRFFARYRSEKGLERMQNVSQLNVIAQVMHKNDTLKRLLVQENEREDPDGKRSSTSNSSSTKRILIDNSAKVSPPTSECSWVNHGAGIDPPYYMSAILGMRIYENDKSELTSSEVKQWLLYMRYIGVDHVYVYDAYVSPEESQKEPLKKFSEDNYITYIDWNDHTPFTTFGTHVASYQHAVGHYGHDSWHVAIDLDEYPFSPTDVQPGFLPRFVKTYSTENPRVSEITMQNFLFLGRKHKNELMIERLWRHTHGPANALVKPIYKPTHIRRAQIHHNNLREGVSRNAPTSLLRMNHYWGARLQNWGEDTAEILNRTEEDRSMEPIVEAFKKCEQYVRPYLD